MFFATCGFAFFPHFLDCQPPRSVFPPLFPSCFGHGVGEFMYCRYGICCGRSRPGYFRCPFFVPISFFFAPFSLFARFFSYFSPPIVFSRIDSIDCFFLLTRINRSLPRKQSGCEFFYVLKKNAVFYLIFREQILNGCSVFCSKYISEILSLYIFLIDYSFCYIVVN